MTNQILCSLTIVITKEASNHPTQSLSHLPILLISNTKQKWGEMYFLIDIKSAKPQKMLVFVTESRISNEETANLNK